MAALLRRLDLFWLGAGGFLTLFGANELIAYATSPVPRWLGGPLVVVAEALAVLIGLAVMYGLGVREPLVKTPPVGTAPAAQNESDDVPSSSESPVASAPIDTATAGKTAKKKRKKSAAEALPPLCGSGTSFGWLRSSTNSKA
jgi:hypothetical protein